jgi:DNA-directed RNA polymerase subunit RPC12/RpoP
MNEKISGNIKQYACPQCGGHVTFLPGTSSLTCAYCGFTFDINDPATHPIEEKDFLSHSQSEVEKNLIAWTTVRCKACGAIVKLDNYTVGDLCPFCGTPMVVEQTTIQRVIKPEGVIPFQIPQKKAYELFQQWKKKLWFAPSAFKKWHVVPDKFLGMYVPYWTFDAQTTTAYRGLRGEYYYVTVTTTVNGKTQQRTERRIRWSPRSGTVQYFFDDVLVVASSSLPTKYVYELEPWDLKLLMPFDDRYLLGFKTEMYQLPLKEAFEVAKNRMEPLIVQLIRDDIGGDEQQILAKETTYENVTFKHILLPIYLSSFRFKNKIYHFLINGQTGEVQGERPYSFWKIFFFVLFILAFIGILLWITGAFNQLK